MIITYLISFSILIVSVIKMTDTVLSLDQKHQKIKEEFVQKTRSTLSKIKNDKGNMTIMGAMLTFILSGFIIFLIYKHDLELKESKYRKESYLCMTYLNIETEKYVSAMSKFNWVFRGLFISLAAGVNTPQIKLIIESTKKIRLARHIAYLKNLKSNKFCNSFELSLSYLSHLPYKTNNLLYLETEFDESTILGEKKWTVILFKKPKGIRLKKSFYLKTYFSLESSFSSNLKVETSEIPIVDLSDLNSLSGQPSS